MDWQPFELRPGAPEEGWAIPGHVRARMDAPNNPLKLRAQKLGIVMAERQWVPSSRRAHECTEFARSQGKLEPFHASLLEAYWTQGKDLHDWALLESAATHAGLDAAAMREAVEAGVFKPAVDERVAAAHALGVHAVPTFLLGDRLIIEGAQTLEVFRRALLQLQNQP